MVLAAAACSSAGGSGPGAAAASSSPAAASTAAVSSLEQQYEQVVARVLRSVVQISTSSGSGSGVVYDTQGDIVTNAHVVGTATTLQWAWLAAASCCPRKLSAYSRPVTWR
jgi:S1-C subfamily serine protease